MARGSARSGVPRPWHIKVNDWHRLIGIKVPKPSGKPSTYPGNKLVFYMTKILNVAKNFKGASASTRLVVGSFDRIWRGGVAAWRAGAGRSAERGASSKGHGLGILIHVQ